MQIVEMQCIVSSLEKSTKCSSSGRNVAPSSAFFPELDNKRLVVNMGQKSDLAASRCTKSDSENDEDQLFRGTRAKFAGKD